MPRFAATRPLLAIGAALAAALIALPARAVVLESMNLAALATRADSIVRARVIDVRPSELEIGGGRLPVVQYELEVIEVLKPGSLELQAQGTRRVARITTLGRREITTPNGAHTALHGMSDMPALRTGETYALFVTAPSSAGLSAPLGLAQGAFQMTSRPGQEPTAMNGVDNTGLLHGMRVSGLRSGTPLTWSDLKRLTLQALAESRSTRGE